MEGTVKWFNGQKGYGFISGNDGEDYFVHMKQLPEGLVLREGDSVSFEVVETERGKQAQNVSLIQETETQETETQDSVQETEETETEE